MTLRKTLVAVLTIVMVSPLWGGGEPLGNITASSDATVRDTKLTPGSTVFLDDVISVAEKGAAQIALTDGGQAEVLGNSSIRLTMVDHKIQMVVDRGQASFHVTGMNGMSALVADATVRPLEGGETWAIIQSLSETHAIVAAQKGTLLLTTAHDGKVYTLREGEAADLSATPDPQQNGGAVPAGKAAPPISVRRKKAVIWVVIILSAGVAVTAYLLARDEMKLPTKILGNEISPMKLN